MDTEELSHIQTCSNISHETINKRLKKLMRVGPSEEGRKGEKRMQCKNREIFVNGLKMTKGVKGFKVKQLKIMMTNDKTGKTLTVTDNDEAFTFPAEEIARWLK